MRGLERCLYRAARNFDLRLTIQDRNKKNLKHMEVDEQKKVFPKLSGQPNPGGRYL
jgi:hypothetical protein